MKTYPKGTRFGNYFLATDQGREVIRRQVTLSDGSRLSQRYPRSKYQHLKSTEELSQLVDRLNHREGHEKRRAIELKTAFIPSTLLEEFRAQLKLEIPNQKDFRYQYKTVLMRYFLNFFVNELGLLDPNQWYQHQSRWAAALLGQADDPKHNIFKRKMSFATISKTIQIANRFMSLLHVKNPKEYDRVIFDPISRGTQNAYVGELQRARIDANGIGQYISPSDWIIIEKTLTPDIRPFAILSYYYGLRRGESLGFERLDSIKKGYLKVSQQLTAITLNKVCTYSAVKDKDKRKTPHWFCTPKDAYDLISDGFNRKMHPDTYAQRWSKLMSLLKFDYDLHDLRRTFITRALRLHNPRDVQLAVGHTSLETTMKYAMDDRDHSDETFNPFAS